MDISRYRDKYLSELQKAQDETPSFSDFLREVASADGGPENLVEGEDDVVVALRIARDKTRTAETRIIAMNGIVAEIGESDDHLSDVFGILRDSSEATEVREAALKICQILRFSSSLLNARVAELREILRGILAEHESRLRTEAASTLAKEKDEYVQRKLIAGLKGEEPALVPAEKAIQLLGYDIHSEVYPLLRKIVANPPNIFAKREALRILGADSDSKELIKESLVDKHEDQVVRQTSAAALRSLAPFEFKQEARKIVLDDEDDASIRATSIKGLELAETLGGGESESGVEGDQDPGDDAAFIQKLREMRGSSSDELSRAASSYLSKLKPE